LLKENAELREIIRIQKENATLRDQARRLSVPDATLPAQPRQPQMAGPADAARGPAVESPRSQAAADRLWQSPEARGWYAADMPTKAAPIAPAAYYDWTGPYIGLNAGWGTGGSRATQSIAVGAVNLSSFADHPLASNGFLGGA